tara:strand:- start:2537 stop:3118 length:582 start_codon:yes stop_codon:yes gene_type:complete
MKKRLLLAALSSLVISSFSTLAQEGEVDIEKIRAAGLKTAVVNAEKIEGSIISEVFTGSFYSTSIQQREGEEQGMLLSLVHASKAGVIRSYGKPNESSSRASIMDFIRPDFTVGLDENDPQTNKLLQAIRLVYKIDNAFPHVVKRNTPDVWTLGTAKGENGFYEGFRVKINAETKPVAVRFDTRITVDELRHD